MDELFAGDAIDPQALAHLHSCARCTARHDALRDERARFLAEAPSFTAQAALAGVPRSSAVARAPRRLVARGVIGALAMAAATLLIVLGRDVETPHETYPTADATRAKGAPRLGMFIKRDGRVQRADRSASVRGGDLLRFTYSSHTPRYLALLNVEGKVARVYLKTTEVAAGQDVALDFSVEQDDSREREGILAIFCSQPFDAEPLRKALETRGELPELAADCAIDSIALEKLP